MSSPIKLCLVNHGTCDELLSQRLLIILGAGKLLAEFLQCAVLKKLLL